MDDSPLSEQAPTEPRLCKNCGKKLSKKGSFCPHCSQRDFDGRVRMRDLMGKFFHSLTHLDNRFVKIVWHLLVPGKVSDAYFQGKIRRYPHPVQFYFVVAFFFLLMLNKTIAYYQKQEEPQEAFQVNVKQDGDRTTRDIKLKGDGFFPLLVQYQKTKEYRAAYDSLPVEWRNEQTRQALDSVLSQVNGAEFRAIESMLTELDSATGRRETLDTLPISIGIRSIRVATADIVHLEPDAIVQKYGLSNWLDQVAVRQGIRTLKDPPALLHYYFGSLAWTLLGLIAVMSGVLWVLFRKKRPYYVEHFIFLMHHNSGELLVYTLALVVNLYLIPLKAAWLLVALWLVTAFFLALKRFYKQGIGLTFLKMMIYYLLYVVCGIILFLAAMLVVFVIF